MIYHPFLRQLLYRRSWEGATPPGTLGVTGQALGTDAAPITVDIGALPAGQCDIDWLIPTSITNSVPTWDALALHMRKTGRGQLLRALSWGKGGVGGTANVATVKRSCPAADDTQGGLANDQAVPYVNGINQAGAGFYLRLPATTTKRVLRVWVGHANGDAQMTAHLTDGSAADQSASVVVAGTLNANSEDVFTCTYQAGRDYNAWVEIFVGIAVVHIANSANIGLAALALGSV